MAGYLFDTNILIHLLKGDKMLLTRTQSIGLPQCFLSEIVVAEMLYGIARSAPERQATNRERFEQLLTTFTGRVLLIGPALEAFAQHKARLRGIGRPVADLDLFIGCTALAHDLTLVTRNTRHFADLPGLRLKNWIDAP